MCVEMCYWYTLELLYVNMFTGNKTKQLHSGDDGWVLHCGDRREATLPRCTWHKGIFHHQVHIFLLSLLLLPFFLTYPKETEILQNRCPVRDFSRKMFSIGLKKTKKKRSLVCTRFTPPWIWLGCPDFSSTYFLILWSSDCGKTCKILPCYLDTQWVLNCLCSWDHKPVRFFGTVDHKLHSWS